MKIIISNERCTLYQGESEEILPTLATSSVDAIITDPPYGLKFMRKRNKWDYACPTVEDWQRALRVLKPGGHLVSFAGRRTYHRVCVNIEDAGFEMRDMLTWLFGTGYVSSKALPKPAHEPIILARKPGGSTWLGIDAARTETGRWPCDVVHDGSAVVEEIFPQDTKSGGGRKGEDGLRSYVNRKNANCFGPFKGTGGVYDPERDAVYVTTPTYHDSGSASRYFYCVRASRNDRNEGLPAGMINTHSCVKPVNLMRWLARLTTPPGGVILDQYAGSGSTGKAAMLEGFGFVGIEREEEYVTTARYRIEHARKTARSAALAAPQPTLFDNLK